jgi:alpha-glucosidase
VLAFSRGPHAATDASLVCVVNLSAAPVPLPVPGRVLLASGPLSDDGLLPTDTAVWVIA